MGTASINAKFPKMRKAQEFIVYPLKAGDDAKSIKIQSDTRMGSIDTTSGEVTLTKPYANGAGFIHLQVGKTHSFKLSEDDLEKVKAKVFSTADKEAGKSFVITDNSGAKNIFDL